MHVCRFASERMRFEAARVRVLTVLSFTMDPYTLLGEELADASERQRVGEEAVENATRGPREIFEEAGAHVEVAHRFGNPADEILEEIKGWGPDLVVIGRRGLSAPKRWILGSVSERVLRHAQVPVLVSG
jgi:nucleotide-binding universal stress UspA family protein